MAVTWTISTLESTTEGGVVGAHWRASDIDEGHSGTSYGFCEFYPDPSSENYIPYNSLTEADVLEWVKASVDAVEVEKSISAQIQESKSPEIIVGVPWSSEVGVNK